ncbi:MAG TPA: VIT domain-containing protein [Fimbriiglobus sp.]|nr:VIT domain-containing protein [Fimbriiglobus sp.]
MRSRLLFGVLLVAAGQQAHAAGLLIPDDVKLPPLAMVNHKVTVTIDDQVASTTVEQTFRNHTDRPLEATYLFPVPKGATVNKFTMWVDGKETAGELLDAKKANQVYTDIVRRTKDPGLLDYLGNNLMRLRVFPVPPKGDQKVKISFTSVAPMEQGVVEYVYPLKTDSRGVRTLEEFSVKLTIKSQHPVQTVYSPTHAIDVMRTGDREVAVAFAKDQALLDKDFQLFYGLGDQEIGLTPLAYRPVSAEDGYFMLLISPQTESMKTTRVPRDLVLVLDTSGSMSDLKMSQAKKALQRLLDGLGDGDRFGLVSFASAVRTYEDKLVPASADQLEKARKWVGDLRAGGGTAIMPALDAALDMRTKDASRSFTVVFFTDGIPTLDERDPAKIVKNVTARAEKSENTRIFTFGVGDDVNAAMLDQLADATRAVSTYVRPAEDIEVKASALSAKVSHPVMTNVKITTTNVKLHEIYPPRLPDLFHGGQLVVIGRYSGQGPAAIKLTGLVGTEERELVYELTFPTKSDDGKEFVEHLWARRKVGYLLDQIRVNGESKEVVDEVVALAKKYGIATPYTSYLVVPDAPMPITGAAGQGGFMPGNRFGQPLQFGASGPGGLPAGLAPPSGASGAGGLATAVPKPVADFAREKAAEGAQGGKPGDGVAKSRGGEQDKLLDEALKKVPAEQRAGRYAEALKRSQDVTKALKDAQSNWQLGQVRRNQEGKLGVDLAEASNNLRGQCQLSLNCKQAAYGRNCVEISGVWIDDQFKADTKAVVVKAQSEAYFRILETHPKMKAVFCLGNHLVWVAPSGQALVIDARAGQEKLADEEIARLFAAPSKK